MLLNLVRITARSAVAGGSAPVGPRTPAHAFRRARHNASLLVRRVLIKPAARRRSRRLAEHAAMAVDDHLLRDIGLTRMDVRATAWGLIGKRGSAGSQPDVADAKRRTGSRAERLATPSDAPARWMFAAAAALGLAVMLLTATVSRPSAAPPDGAADGESIRRGRYLVRIGGCNDCHTPGYMLANGEVPEERWLIGGQIGFNGTWGTTYAPNLRTYMSAITEDGWVDVARTMKTRPPMPWFNLRHMREEDLRAVYRYVRSLPPDSNAVPAYVPPGREPTTPYIVFMPQEPK